MARPLFLLVGWLSVGLGFLGIIMPLFPTTPFLLVAVWAFSKSSPELAVRIRSHRVAGPYIIAWQDHGVIPTKAKALAVTMLAAMLAYLHFGVAVAVWIEIAVAIVLAITAIYIVLRPGNEPL